MSAPDPLDPDEVRRRLLDERQQLLESSEARQGDRRPVELDQQSVGRLSRMDALQMQAMALETERRRQTRLGRIEAALARLDAGAFGECVVCGEPIAPRRLELDLTTPTCLRCAEGAG
jgi:DnaK suppressor protein